MRSALKLRRLNGPPRHHNFGGLQGFEMFALGLHPEMNLCMDASGWLPRLVSLCLILTAVSVNGLAQSKQPGGATISGHVFYADSDKPARFASVYLKPMTPVDPGDDFFTTLMDSAIVNMQKRSQGGGVATSEDEHDLSAARSAANGFLTSVGDAMLSATIGAEGEYVFKNVPPGAYFLHVKAAGYIDTLAQFSPQELASHDPEVQKKIVAAVENVSVAGTEQVHEDLSLNRGGTLSGRLLYDDGSPATGWKVRALPRQNESSQPSNDILGIDLSQLPVGQPENRAVTDDTGRFRIAGLPGGKFILEAKLTTAALNHNPFSPVSSQSGSFLSILGGLSGMSGLQVTVYSGSTTRLNDALVIPVHSGEEYTVADMVVALHAAHSVAGSVVSKSDGHTVNDGTVELIAQDSNGKDDASLRLSASIQPDGTFRFDYVPSPGNYVLRARHASDTTVTSQMKLLGSMIAERSTLRSFAPAKTMITLEDSDVTGVRLTVSDSSQTASLGK